MTELNRTVKKIIGEIIKEFKPISKELYNFMSDSFKSEYDPDTGWFEEIEPHGDNIVHAVNLLFPYERQFARLSSSNFYEIDDLWFDITDCFTGNCFARIEVDYDDDNDTYFVHFMVNTSMNYEFETTTLYDVLQDKLREGSIDEKYIKKVEKTYYDIVNKIHNIGLPRDKFRAIARKLNKKYGALVWFDHDEMWDDDHNTLDLGYDICYRIDL